MNEQSTPYDEAIKADPETHPWGFFSVDPWANGAGVLLWFESPQALLAGVREGEPALYLDDDANATAALQGKIDQLLARLEGGAEPRAVLAGLDDACEATVIWVGQLEDLFHSGDGWAVERRVEFRDEDADADDPDADASPITENERAEFIEYIRAYVLG
jgi:hypothetical protein